MTLRKKLIAAGAAVVAAAALAGIVYGYFAAHKDKPNLVGVGEDDISITESFTPPEQSKQFTYRKLVKITNTGSVPCYIRVRLEFSSSEIQSHASFSCDTSDPPDENSFRPASPASTGCYAATPPDGWVYVWDQDEGNPTPGFYYYKDAVNPGEATEALLSWVKMDYGESEIQAHDIYVYSESVQTVNPNSGAEYTDWKDAWRTFEGA